jgi:hypothetical protein
MRERRHSLHGWEDNVAPSDGIWGEDETMERDPIGSDELEKRASCVRRQLPEGHRPIALVREEAREGVDQEVICDKRDAPNETLLREDATQRQSGEMNTPTLQKYILTLMEQLHPLGFWLFAASWGLVRNYNAITAHCRTDGCRTIVLWESPLVEKQEQHREYEQLSPTDIVVNTLEKQTQEILLGQIPQFYCPVFYEVRATAQQSKISSREVQEQQVMLRSNENVFDRLLRKLSIGTPASMFDHAVQGIRSMLSDTPSSMFDHTVLGIRSMLSDDFTMGDEKIIEFNTKLKTQSTASEGDTSVKDKSKTCSWLESVSSVFEGVTACY